MDGPPENSDKRSARLPALYINPWSSLRRDISGIFADIGLRSRELWRRNYIGEFPRPSFWPSGLAFLFWPFLITCSLLTLFLLLFLLSFLEISSESLDLRTVPESNTKSISTGLTSDHVSSKDTKKEAQFIEERWKETKPAESDPLLVSLLEAEFPGNLLETAEVSLEGNAVRLKLKSSWEEISLPKKIALADDLQLHISNLGYDELHLMDASGQLLSRSARIGQRMILLEGGG